MGGAGNIKRIGGVIAIASLAAGCIQPVYQAPGPIPLLNYPPPVSYRSIPDYREAAPMPLQPAPAVEPLPPPAAPPATASMPSDDLGGSIPVQDMPAPASTASTAEPATDPAAAAATPTPTVRKVPTATAGATVPLEGFRPMHSQTRPAP